MTGNPRVWNRMLRDLRNPPPFYNVTPNTPQPLAWGKQHEERALALWWDRHPLLDLDNPVCVPYHDETNGLWFRHTVVSPDRVIYDPSAKKAIAGLELKCPWTPGVVRKWIESGARCPDEHVDQCVFGMIVTGLPSWRFVAFDPREEEDFQFFDVPVLVPESYMNKMRDFGTRFLEMLESGNEFEPTAKRARRYKEMFHGY
jgi:hypothetical protein